MNALGMSATTYNNMESLFSFDALVSTVLAIVTMVSLPSLPWNGDDDTVIRSFVISNAICNGSVVGKHLG